MPLLGAENNNSNYGLRDLTDQDNAGPTDIRFSLTPLPSKLNAMFQEFLYNWKVFSGVPLLVFKTDFAVLTHKTF